MRKTITILALLAFAASVSAAYAGDGARYYWGLAVQRGQAEKKAFDKQIEDIQKDLGSYDFSWPTTVPATSGARGTMTDKDKP